MIKNITSALLSATIVLLRPVFGIAGVCRFTVSCSAYACYVLEHESFMKALMLIMKRLSSCSFFTRY